MRGHILFFLKIFFPIIFSSGILLYIYRVEVFRKDATSETVTLIENNTQCDLQADSCDLEFPAGEKIRLEITPRPIFANQKQKAILTLRNAIWKIDSIDFSGVNMEMGFNRPKFKKVSQNEYHAEFILEACTSNQIKWQALILVDEGITQKLGIPFYFTVRKK